MPTDADLEPDHPLSFRIDAADVVVRPNGRPMVVAHGRGPAIPLLDAWTLVAFVDRGRLSFAGLHRSLVFRDRPLVRFFSLEGVLPATVGSIDAACGLDLALVDGGGKITDHYVFTYAEAPALDGGRGTGGRAPPAQPETP